MTETITTTDEEMAGDLEACHLPALLPALAQATGDLSLLRDGLRPVTAAPPPPQGGLSAEQLVEARELALAALQALRDGGEAERANAGDLRRMMEWMTGSTSASEYLPLLIEELSPFDEDPRAPQWRKDPATEFSVAIIGAGMSGIVAGARLKQAGVPFVVIEKNPDVGGTWLENTYPGARVDVSNAFYSYSFAQRVDWPQHYSPQDVLLNYFRDCAEEYGVREQVRFNTEVLSCEYDDDRNTWALLVRNPDGGEERIEANAVVSAVGQLNQPKLPDIAGRGSFEGPSFHSARWDHDVDLGGKRVGVVGTGASAAQFIPAIAADVEQLTVFQRTPPWLVAVPHYQDEVPEGQQWLFQHVPHYAHWFRFWLFWTTVEGMLPAARVDPEWGPQERSVSAENDGMRAMMTAYLEQQFADRPDLLAQVLPQYAPASKRLVLDNGAWASALMRENVELVTEPIAEITPRGVTTTDGEERAFDALLYGTGFQASRFLTPMTVVGRGGVALHEQWDGDARAYMGITVPNFPNMFLMYGPNTNIVVNGSIIFFSECEVQYILKCIRLLLEEGHRAMDCTSEAHDAYNERIDEANSQMVWGVATVNSWYRNETGRSAQNWPFSLLEYWEQTRRPDPAAYEFL
ncbi:MAG: NAD(P)/FAD-dependent oxidoreductase [Dehalococcoidia bacterium]|nr:NAD(P)/FAD-dependent oxidoreductase [Dehalococcoidia bacterium]